MKTHFIIALLVLSASAYAITTTTYTSSGNYTVPTGATYILVEAHGAGGNGASVLDVIGSRDGGGGGGGAYAASIFPVTPGTTYNLTVGQTDGSPSWFNTTTALFAAGGGNGSTSGAGGTGGTTAASTGQIEFPGGDGGSSSVGAPFRSGSGGGGAGTNQAGSAGQQNNGSGLPGGTGGSLYGGDGGAVPAQSGNADTGLPGNTVGGGGSGAWSNGGGPQSGGGGARGEVRITAVTGNYSSLNITIYDENTLTIINTTNITVVSASTGENVTVNTYITSAGTLYLPMMEPGTYTLQFSGGSYAARQYVATIPETISSVSLTAYMSTASTQTNFVLTAANGPDAGQYISGATVTLERSINGSFVTVESRYSDVSGTAGPFTYNNTAYYRITITADDYTTKQFTLNPIQFSSYDVLLMTTTSFTNPEDYEGVSITFTPKVYYNTQLNNVTFIFASPNGTFLFANYTIEYPTGNASNNTSNAYGATLTSNFTITGATFYSTVTVRYCYNTAVGGEKCFREEYPVQTTYANNTLATLPTGSADIGDLEAILLSSGATGAITGGASMVAGPIGGGIAWLFCMTFFYLVFNFSIWLLLVPAVVGFFIVMYGSGRI